MVTKRTAIINSPSHSRISQFCSVRPGMGRGLMLPDCVDSDHDHDHDVGNSQAQDRKTHSATLGCEICMCNDVHCMMCMWKQGDSSVSPRWYKAVREA